MSENVPIKLINLCLRPDSSIAQALRTLEKYHREIVLVVDGEGILLGTVTDGDIRRALIDGKALAKPLSEVMCTSPVTGNTSATQRDNFDQMRRHRILQLPITEPDGRIVDLVLLSEAVQVDIPLADTQFDEREVEAVGEVLRSGWLSMGDMTQRFESAFAEFIGVQQAIAVTNGTAALHLALSALGLGRGDEVLCPSLTFVATSNAILYTGATPVFCDIVGDGDLTIDPKDLVARITPRTKAIVVMHYGGYSCDMPAIARIAKERDLLLIEDAAHAPGARLAGRHCGNWGDIGCFSFFANKNMTTGEGGMVTTNSDKVAEKLRLMRSHGMTTLTLDRHRGRALSYDVVEMGYNYRLDEMRAAMGLVQLGQLTDWNNCRRRLVLLYRSLLETVPGVIVPFNDFDVDQASCHIMPILFAPGIDRNSVMRGMRGSGIQTSIHYPAIHTFSYYREKYPSELALTEDVASRQLTLPLYPTMTECQVERVVAVLADGVAAEERTETVAMRH